MEDSKGVHSIQEMVREGAERLSGVSDTPLLDAQLLFRHLSGFTPSNLVARSQEPSSDWRTEFEVLLTRRCAGEPVAYIIGKKEFYGLDFFVDSRVLIPRPETELLVELALLQTERLEDGFSLLDIGTGSGCIAITLAVELQKRGRRCTIGASDVSASALAVARENASRHGVLELISFREGNLLDPWDDVYDIVVSNPPYIARGDSRVSPGLHFEPDGALYSGPSGLEVIKGLITGFPIKVSSSGVLLVEFGEGQGGDIRALVSREGDAVIELYPDLAGIDRVAKISRNG